MSKWNDTNANVAVVLGWLKPMAINTVSEDVMPNTLYDEGPRYAKVKVEQTEKGYVASLFLDKKLAHKTAPMLAKKNAIMLINRKIQRLNIGKRSIDHIPLYKE
jgi:hypothetical protein